jgi:ribosomal 50S subunit-associated protein YjgA (DUF615 family)
VPALTHLLKQLLADRKRLRSLGRAARQRMADWSPSNNIAATVQAVRSALKRRRAA